MPTWMLHQPCVNLYLPYENSCRSGNLRKIMQQHPKVYRRKNKLELGWYVDHLLTYRNPIRHNMLIWQRKRVLRYRELILRNLTLQHRLPHLLQIGFDVDNPISLQEVE